ncbi:MAG: hypothetical protein SGJ27_02995 [Candidatus Melainabacteria bacterium]|nr:hypothetical protein [Candidatus Melainabacteria bacterium]
MQEDDATTDSAEEEYIGECIIEEDGTLILRMRAVGPRGMIGSGTMTYRTDHPNYAEVLQHIGPIKPGENKPVRPFPD